MQFKKKIPESSGIDNPSGIDTEAVSVQRRMGYRYPFHGYAWVSTRDFQISRVLPKHKEDDQAQLLGTIQLNNM